MKKYILFLALMLLVLSALTGAVLADYAPVQVATNTTFNHTLTLRDEPYALGYKIVYKFTVNETDYPKGIWQKTAGENPPEIYDASPFVSGDPKIVNSAEYNPGDTFDANHQKNTTITVDWSSVTFSEPGVYFWEVKETVDKDNTDKNIPDGQLDDTEHSYYLWAYVTDNNLDGKLEVTVGRLANASNLSSKGEPVRTFPATTVDLAIKKIVSGNQGSRDQYFPFQIDITLSSNFASTIYEVSGNYTKEDQIIRNSPYYKEGYIHQPNETVVINDDPITIWLKHDEYFEISGLPYGSGYTVSEAAAGYTTTITVQGDGDTKDIDFSDKSVSEQSLTYIQGTTTVTFDNSRDGDIPTGIELEYTTPIIGLILAVVLVGFVFVPRRQEENQE